ncbi:MAG: iron complex outermembrane receptor protein [Alteromonadaceae bacterium]|jgi:iron complex outermembrane receptor protein
MFYKDSLKFLGEIIKMKKSKLSLSIKSAIALAGTSMLIASNSFAMAESEENTEATEAQQIERIAVTGSRIRRVDLEATQPVVSIGSDFIGNRGITNLADALTDIPGVSSGVSDVRDGGPSNSAALGQNTIDLYGLGAQRTLSLVNGSRFVSSNSPVSGGVDSTGRSANGSQVDTNNIPVSLIERVEVVKVGGAPVYGADAVAGVVNYILKKDYEGLEFSVDTSSIPDVDDATTKSFRVLMGGNFNDDKGNLVLSYEYNKSTNIARDDVPSVKNLSRFFPAHNGVADGSGNIPSNQQTAILNPRVGVLSYGGVVAPIPLVLANIGLGAWGEQGFWHFDPNGSGEMIPYDAGAPANSVVWASGGDGLDLDKTATTREGVERYNLSLFGNYKISDQVNFAVTAFSNRSDAAYLGYQTKYTVGSFPFIESALRFDTSHPLLTNSARTKIEELNGGPGTFFLHKAWLDLNKAAAETNSSVNSIKVAFDGELEYEDYYWNWDVSYQKGVSITDTQSSAINNHKFLAAMDVGVNPATNQLDCKFNYVEDYDVDFRAQGQGIMAEASGLGKPGDCSVLNPFATPEQAAIDYMTYNQLGQARIEQDIFQVNFSGNLMELPAGEVGLAIGYDHRTERATFTSGSVSTFVGSADVSTNGQYVTQDIYGELYIPLISGDMNIPLVHKLSTEMSFRSIDNDIAGKDNVWAVGLNYHPIDDLMIRANMGETIRAPSVGELFQPRAESGEFAREDPCQATKLKSGPNPAVRQANCKAEDFPADFKSNAAEASVSGYSGGNPDLKSEQAKSKNVGLIYSPSAIEGLSMSVDWVNIKIEDAIVSFTLDDTLAACYDSPLFPNEFCGNVKRDENHQILRSNAFQTGYVNAALNEFESVEYSISYRQPVRDWPLLSSLLSAGDLGISLRAINLKKQETSNTGFDFSDITGQYDLPEWRGDINISYNLDNFVAYMDVNYHGRGKVDITSNEEYQYIGLNGKPITHLDTIVRADLGAVYHFSDSISIRGRVDNVFDWSPTQGGATRGRWTFGRTFSLGMTAKF